MGGGSSVRCPILSAHRGSWIPWLRSLPGSPGHSATLPGLEAPPEARPRHLEGPLIRAVAPKRQLSASWEERSALPCCSWALTRMTLSSYPAATLLVEHCRRKFSASRLSGSCRCALDVGP